MSRPRLDRVIYFFASLTPVDVEQVGEFGQEVGPQVGPIDEEQHQQGWAKDKALLLEMKAAVEQVPTLGHSRLPAVLRDAFVIRYDTLLGTGLAANPPSSSPERGRRRRGRIKQSPMRLLLERLWRGRDQVLAFLDDLTIPFGNHQAERDLRMLKVQREVSGCFRSDSGAEAFSRLRGYLSP